MNNIMYNLPPNPSFVSKYFHQYGMMFASNNSGWKLSIQGKTKEDRQYLIDKLHDYLLSTKITHKYGTDELLLLDSEQRNKLLTIYIPKGIELNTFMEDIYQRIIDYKGWHDVKTPTLYEHYAGGIFYRNDRDANGNYISAIDAQKELELMKKFIKNIK